MTFSDLAPPPRSNGALVFSAPWQSRIFGLTVTLEEQGLVSWPKLQAALIDEVAGADAAKDDTGDPATYWGCWLRAVVSLGVVETDLLSVLVDELSRREVGHDH